MTVAVSSASGFTTGSPKILGSSGYFFGASGRTYDVSADGARFLMIKQTGVNANAAAASIVVVQNWFEELKRRVPAP